MLMNGGHRSSASIEQPKLTRYASRRGGGRYGQLAASAPRAASKILWFSCFLERRQGLLNYAMTRAHAQDLVRLGTQTRVAEVCNDGSSMNLVEEGVFWWS